MQFDKAKFTMLYDFFGEAEAISQALGNKVSKTLIELWACGARASSAGKKV